MAKNSKAKIKANQKYSEKNYKRIVVYVKNDYTDTITAFCSKYGYSRNNLFNEAVREKIEREEKN